MQVEKCVKCGCSSLIELHKKKENIRFYRELEVKFYECRKCEYRVFLDLVTGKLSNSLGTILKKR